MTRQIGGMELEGSTVLILGGAGLVGEAVARALLPQGPRRVVIAGLTREEAEESVQELRAEFPAGPPPSIPTGGTCSSRRR
jgi:NAD(P)-dependent dehydrogenase (short-subunit alcohol dehydrogenase family)